MPTIVTTGHTDSSPVASWEKQGASPVKALGLAQGEHCMSAHNERAKGRISKQQWVQGLAVATTVHPV
jgi:hypothetical protein